MCPSMGLELDPTRVPTGRPEKLMEKLYQRRETVAAAESQTESTCCGSLVVSRSIAIALCSLCLYC